MKNIILITIVLLFSVSCKAQLNNLNETELFDGIKFNNISLRNIMNSKGNLTQMKVYLF